MLFGTNEEIGRETAWPARQPIISLFSIDNGQRVTIAYGLIERPKFTEERRQALDRARIYGQS
jgi:hypothetical protein